MGDDILEIKPALGPFTLNLRALARRLQEKGNYDPVAIVAERFLQIFQEHGVAVSQIPRMIPQLRLEQLRTTDSLLQALTGDVLERAANLFRVRLEWLEGADECIYEPLFCYQQPHALFDHCATLNLPSYAFAVQALTTTKALDCRNDRQQPIALVLVDKVQELGKEEITRYCVYRDAWNWSHQPCRIQLKAMARLVLQNYRRPVPLHQVKPALLQAIIEGKCVPHAALQGCLLTNPSLEDYALPSHESAQAKEISELPAVLDYIDSHNLEDAARLAFERSPA
jgi:hypothetical protein